MIPCSSWDDVERSGAFAFVAERVLAFDHAVLQMGFCSGYIPNATAMIASQAPRERADGRSGTLSTGAIAGNLIGPSMGGALAQWFGMENVFLITGALLMITTVLTIFLVKEDFHPIEKKI